MTPSPDPLMAEEEAELRRRLATSNGPDDDVGYAVFGWPGEAEDMATRLLATLDAARALPSAPDHRLREALTDVTLAHRHLLGDSDVSREDASAHLLEVARTLRAVLSEATSSSATPSDPLDEDRVTEALADVLAENHAHIQHETSGYDMPVKGIAVALAALLSASPLSDEPG